MIALLLAAASGAAFTCVPVRVHDGDTFTCAGGRRVRTAGVQAPDFENTGPCRRRATAYTCDDAAALAARRTVERLVLRRRLACRAVDLSYGRTVARCTLPDNRSLSCATIAAGAAKRWSAYWRRYGMGECR